MRYTIGMALVTATLPLVGCTTEPCPAIEHDGIAVQVRDAITGVPAAEGATAVVTEGEFSETLTRFDELVFYGLRERPGAYELIVSKAEYITFTEEDVEVEEGDCGVETEVVEVEIMPVTIPTGG